MPTTKKLELYSYDANPDGTVKISSLMKTSSRLHEKILSTIILHIT